MQDDHAAQAATRPALSLASRSSRVRRDSGGARGSGCGCHGCLLLGQVRSPARSSLNWISATAARMRNRITERALA